MLSHSRTLEAPTEQHSHLPLLAYGFKTIFEVLIKSSLQGLSHWDFSSVFVLMRDERVEWCMWTV